MDHKKRGLALIFNHEVFDCNSPRKGTRADRDNLQRTLESMDFDVQIFENETISEIKGILEESEYTICFYQFCVSKAEYDCLKSIASVVQTGF